MKSKTTQEKTASYYSKLGSRLGYILVMKRSQHFGYYDATHTNEDDAQQKYHEEFSKLLKLKPNMKVLDAGCGQGVVASYLASNHDVEIIGITITPHEIKTATKQARKLGVENRTRFILADYANIPFADESFDRVYTTESLSHAPDVNRAISELARVLKPGGILVCAEYEMDYKNFDAKTLQLADLIKDRAAIHGVYQFGKGDFLRTLQNNGLKLLGEYDWTANTKPSFDRLRRLARPLARIAKAWRLEARYINTIAAAMYADGVEKGVFAYKVYVAKKSL